MSVSYDLSISVMQMYDLLIIYENQNNYNIAVVKYFQFVIKKTYTI